MRPLHLSHNTRARKWRCGEHGQMLQTRAQCVPQGHPAETYKSQWAARSLLASLTYQFLGHHMGNLTGSCGPVAQLTQKRPCGCGMGSSWGHMTPDPGDYSSSQALEPQGRVAEGVRTSSADNPYSHYTSVLIISALGSQQEVSALAQALWEVGHCHPPPALNPSLGSSPHQAIRDC